MVSHQALTLGDEVDIFVEVSDLPFPTDAGEGDRFPGAKAIQHPQPFGIATKHLHLGPALADHHVFLQAGQLPVVGEFIGSTGMNMQLWQENAS